MTATGTRKGRLVYHWKHGWIPLDHAAALSKAHGSHAGALRYMPGGKNESVDIRRMSDEHLAEAAKEAAYDQHLANGESPESAYSKAYGVSEERMQRESAISMLRSSGYKGRGFDELSRNAYADHARQTYLDAEDATRGYLLNKAGLRAIKHPVSLFTGPDSRARKYASEELLQYWQDHGRLTHADFKAGLLGGAMPVGGTYA